MRPGEPVMGLPVPAQARVPSLRKKDLGSSFGLAGALVRECGGGAVKAVQRRLIVQVSYLSPVSGGDREGLVFEPGRNQGLPPGGVCPKY